MPTRPLVPWVETVHDRIAIEIMRGCPNLCRFCHAGYTKRPLRLRSVERIVELAEQSYAATGHTEIGLLSLSTADYPRLGELAEQLNARFAPRMVNLSFPSLRVDSMLQNIPWMASQVRKAGLTMAIEAAADDLRHALRKKVTTGHLLEGVRAAYTAGWKRVKLYFMAGFPGENEDDIDAIWDLSAAVSRERKQLNLPPAAVSAAVSWLVPKPFTPLQWMAQPRVEYFRTVRERLFELKHLRRASVRVMTHRPEQSVLEAVLARGDRRLGPVIAAAWQRGAKLDSWEDSFDHGRWVEAFNATGVDPDFYAHRERPTSERLPWAHIGHRLSWAYLERAWNEVRSLRGGS